MLEAYWHLHLQGFFIDSLAFFCCLRVDRWAAEWTSSANRDTYCKAPPIASVCQTSLGLGSSLRVSVSAVHQVSPSCSRVAFFPLPPGRLVNAYLHYLLTHSNPLYPPFSCSLGQCLKVRALLTFASALLHIPIWLESILQVGKHPPGQGLSQGAEIGWKSGLNKKNSVPVLCRTTFGVVNSYINEDEQAVSPTGNQKRENHSSRWEEEESMC